MTNNIAIAPQARFKARGLSTIRSDGAVSMNWIRPKIQKAEK
jgi:hypothetical protein